MNKEELTYNEYRRKMEPLESQRQKLDNEFNSKLHAYRQKLRCEYEERYSIINKAITVLSEEWQNISRTFINQERETSTRMDCITMRGRALLVQPYLF